MYSKVLMFILMIVSLLAGIIIFFTIIEKNVERKIKK